MTSAPRKDDLSQAERFKEVARELECDDDDTRFKDRVKKLVRQKQGKEPPGLNEA